MGKKKAAFLLIGWGLIADSSSQINVERSQLFQHGGGGTGQKTAKDVSEWGQAQYGQPMQKKKGKEKKSPCTVIYKVVSKCIVNRLRPLLQDIISTGQSAFIPGRMITDNALIAFECIHAIKVNSDVRGEFCAYKLDLSKAYDRVDWDFLNKVLLKLGFQSSWVQRVMSCVTSVRYTIRFNGAMSAPFFPSRGLRQGIHFRHTFSSLWLMVSLN
jgi:hypothetical protein